MVTSVLVEKRREGWGRKKISLRPELCWLSSVLYCINLATYVQVLIQNMCAESQYIFLNKSNNEGELQAMEVERSNCAERPVSNYVY